MDVVFTFDEGITSTDAQNFYLGTFLCGPVGSAPCQSCHSSCLSCTNGICDSCASSQGSKKGDDSFCSCDVEGGECPPCHSSCGTCAEPSDSTQCTSCAITEATLSNPTGGTCYCGNGYVYQSPATSACAACSSGCSYCIDSREVTCMDSKDLLNFALNLASSYNLPLEGQVNGLICYRRPVPVGDCDPFAAINVIIESTVNGLQPTPDQCYELLKADWPSLAFQFGEIFPRFTLPNPSTTATETEVYMMKTVLWLWILQYGSSVMTHDSLWQDLVAVFNNESLDWKGLLAWGGENPGYLAGGSIGSFPAGLTPTSPELELFNHFSEVCGTSGCGYTTQCGLVKVGSACAPLN